MSVPRDPYAEWDAAYVLGALSPMERLDFEEHLSGCPDCQAAIGDLAGMPGLLAQVPGADVLRDHDPADLPPLAPVPAAEDLTRPPPQRRWRVAVAGIAAGLVLGTLGGFLADDLIGGDQPVATTSGPVRVAFSPVVPTSITAVLDIVPAGAATELKVECQYGGAAAKPDEPPRNYSIYVVGRDGRATEVKTWAVHPNKVMRPSATSDLPVSDIAAVEIRATMSGRTLLRAQVH
ncbi:MAG TPA: zf-HC2 domain-containing protein [Dermatophilaceae bacterium]|nr:zf-HC2 domain-containing protein [Dermatophilaceae bacterium]